jgi:hypothetical protein
MDKHSDEFDSKMEEIQDKFDKFTGDLQSIQNRVLLIQNKEKAGEG